MGSTGEVNVSRWSQQYHALGNGSEARRELAFRGLVLIAAVLLTAYIMDHLVVVQSNSVPYRMAWMVGGVPSKGDYVVFPLVNRTLDASGKTLSLTKQIVCSAGERLRFDGEVYHCGDLILGGFITETWDGRPLQPLAFDQVIPDGQAFVMGTHPRSFDSRYFGLVEVARMTRVKGLF